VQLQKLHEITGLDKWGSSVGTEMSHIDEDILSRVGEVLGQYHLDIDV
jgi:hypothetical protein